jgi:serine/threonine protein kinase
VAGPQVASWRADAGVGVTDGMTGDDATLAQPLRASDPRRLGEYRLLRRLGEGGMGVVYLAAAPTGPLVAIKVIRADVADDPDFRRRFRSEVARARQVPPFCTAEVLDADPDHEPPYLVVEYVDGPSLADAIRDRGRFTPGNLHGLAIGVATALTAIHGAGVIHRDLKPSNVLLAPGSPKVIDFGIARALEGSGGHTRTDQIMGTVGYMAPERFGPASANALTPAADVFSWGAVVAYAGTGRVPFGVDTAPLVALRIMTQPPDLEGLTGPLRELLEEALAKEPADRPTARELLDRLLAVGPARPIDLTATAPAPSGSAPARSGSSGSAPARSGSSGSRATAGVGAEPETATSRPATAAAPTIKFGPLRRGRWRPLGLAAAALVAVGLVFASVASGVVGLPEAFSPGGGPTGSPNATAPAGAPVNAQLVWRDRLDRPYGWHPTAEPRFNATCAFEPDLTVTVNVRQTVYKCPGLADEYTDFAAYVDVTLLEPGNCAAMWFRFNGSAGFALRVCEEGYAFVTHNRGGVKIRRTMPLAIPLKTPVRVGVAAEGDTFRFYRNGVQVDTAFSDAYAEGKVALGILQRSLADTPPYRVSFANLEIWAPGA